MTDFSTMTADDLWQESASANKNYRAEILFELGCRQAAKMNYSRAESLFTESRDLASAVGEELLSGRASYSLGMVHYHRKQYLWAVELFQNAANSYQLCGRFSWQGDAIYFMTQCLIEINDYPGALLNFDFAIGLYESEDNFSESARTYLGKGTLLGFMGEQAEALECFERAQELYAQIEDAVGVSRAIDCAASALLDLDRVDEAVVLLEQAKNTLEYVGDSLDATHAKHRLGEGFKYQGQWQRAVVELEAASFEFKAQEEPVKAALSDLYLAQCLVQLDETARAETLYVQLEAYFTSIHHYRYLGLVELSRAVLASRCENPRLELAQFKKALTLSLKHSDQWLENAARIALAECFVEREDFDKAKGHVEKINIAKIGQQLGFLNRTKNVSAACLVGNQEYSAAEPLLLEVLGAGKGKVLSEERAKASLLLAQIREKEGRIEDAEKLRLSSEKLAKETQNV